MDNKTAYEKVKEWKLKNKDKVREQQRRYRLKNKERLNEYRRNRYKKLKIKGE